MKKLIVRDKYKAGTEIYRIPLADDVINYTAFKLLIKELIDMKIEQRDVLYSSRFELYVIDESP